VYLDRDAALAHPGRSYIDPHDLSSLLGTVALGYGHAHTKVRSLAHLYHHIACDVPGVPPVTYV